ncbi:MAG TPA: DUF6089 family protein [Saprospiraceae bacterium]|nr:DUF6089 family protein [Saprospiraceae bacterium]HMQ84222.1 DUF6089 family protein [Saprospiraceae bacterium]
MRKQILILCLLSSVALSPIKGQYTEIGLSAGASFYSGDLSPSEFGLYLNEVHPAFGAFARFNLNKTLALRLGFNLAKVSGDDTHSLNYNRGLAFRSNITELSLLAEINLFHIGNYESKGITPYVFLGAGFFHFNPEAPFDGDYVALQPLGTEGQGIPAYGEPYQLTQVAFPFGAGLKFQLNETMSINVELGGRKLLTDYLDDVSDTFVNYFDILENNGQLAARLSNPSIVDPNDANTIYTRGGEYKDWYFISSFTLCFRLAGSGRNAWNNGRGLGCPTF